MRLIFNEIDSMRKIVSLSPYTLLILFFTWPSNQRGEKKRKEKISCVDFVRHLSKCETLTKCSSLRQTCERCFFCNEKISSWTFPCEEEITLKRTNLFSTINSNSFSFNSLQSRWNYRSNNNQRTEKERHYSSLRMNLSFIFSWSLFSTKKNFSKDFLSLSLINWLRQCCAEHSISSFDALNNHDHF